MPSALSADLGERVLGVIDAVSSRREAARRFEVSPASAVRWHEAFVREGRTRAKPMGGDQHLHIIGTQADLVRQTCEAKPERMGSTRRTLPGGRAVRTGVDAPLDASKISGRALGVIGCCHVSGL